MSIAELPASLLPTHLDLPHTDDKPVENTHQPLQSSLLSSSLVPHLDCLHPDGRYYIGADCGIYWSHKKEPLEGCKVPDWYYVPNVPRKLNGLMRRSFVMWQESAVPLIVIEYISGNGSEEYDDTPEKGKFWVYEQKIRADYYAIFDPFRKTLEVFHMVRGKYRKAKPNADGRFRIPEMQLDFGILEGEYQGYRANWLRAWDLNSVLLPTEGENFILQKKLTEKERERAEQREQAVLQERQRAEQERQRAEAFAAHLRELGIDPDKL
jgi:Uma2 family endonuclease